MSATLSFTPHEHELKFCLPIYQIPSITDWLYQNFIPHPLYHSSIIHTIYYGTSINHLMEAAEPSCKYRLRWYADLQERPLTGPVYLETKIKEGDLRRKNRCPVQQTPQQWKQLMLDFTSLPDLFKDHWPESISPTLARLQPLLHLSYRRLRFVHPLSFSSYCLDQDIHCCGIHVAAAGHLPVQHPLNISVFEQKGPSSMPDPALAFLSRFGARLQPFSKCNKTLQPIFPL